MYKVDFTPQIPKADLERLKELGCEIHCVGSRTIQGGFTPESDYDFLIFNVDSTPEIMGELGYKLEVGSAHYEPSEGQFNSWRKGDVNLIVTRDHLFKLKFLCANGLAMARRLIDRKDRVSLFQYILYGKGKT